MKVIDAFWEKRNLGVDVQEVVCSSLDSESALRETLLQIRVPYSVVKIPANNIPLLLTAQQCSYVLIETSISYEGRLNALHTPRFYERFLPRVSFEVATDTWVERVLDEMEAGKVFSTDRIAVDPLFSSVMAGRRYDNWCRDELERGAELLVAYYNDNPVAFNLSREDKERTGAFVGLLGGVFSEYLDKGMGFLLVHCETETCRRHGGKWCLGTTSSNNLPSLRLHMHYGFDITSIQYVLIKHQ